MMLEGKTALVTGGRGGIGRAICARFEREGATVFAADLSEGGRLGPRLGAFRFTGDGAFLIAPLLAGWLLGTQGRAIAMLPLVVLTGVVLIGCVIWVPETHRRNVVRPT